MNFKKFLVFDFGASNGKASVANFNGRKFEIDVIHKFDNVPVMASGVLYWDILRLYNDLKTGIQIASKKYTDIVSIGVDAWGADFEIVDKNGKLISNPEHYRDLNRFLIINELFDIISKRELFELTGGLVLPGVSSVFHMFELKKRNATQYLNAHKCLMIPDLFNYFLTGNMFNEYTEATTSVMLNQMTGNWEKKILDKLGFPADIFCDLIDPGTIIGCLQKSVANELEIEPISVVAPATHDTASAIAGFPILDRHRNSLLISMGTWGILVQETAKPVINSTVFETGFANEGGVEGTNLLLISINGLWIIQQCMNKWRKEYGQDFSWKDIDKIYPETTPFKTIINVSDSVFTPVSSDMNETLKRYCSEKSLTVPQTIGEVARTLYESLVLKIKNKIMDIETITTKKIDSIHIVGGGSNNRLFCQWLSDSTGLPLASGPSETTSIGNMLMLLKAAGEIKTLEEGRLISFNSSKIEYYEPRDDQRHSWEFNYEKYLKIL